ncbi:MAG TPA: glucose 1-dehydrogenase [Anaerolineae bacterium]|nr:glucose 1-dehydrogenase [Anaerolineae bacterium]
MLKDKIILITGAAGGIGWATAEYCAQQGARLALADYDQEAGETAANMLQEKGYEAIFLHTDVTSAEQVEKMITATVDHYGQLDGAFNNAGIEPPPVHAADILEKDFDRVMNTNLKGVWLCLKYQLKQMVGQEHGAIVNNASVSGLVGAPRLAGYAASKHGVIGLTKSAALEYTRYGIRINAVCPAVIRTPMVERILTITPQLGEKLVAGNPSRRLGEPHEVGALVAWLLSSAASFVNGSAIPVDGAYSAQ